MGGVENEQSFLSNRIHRSSREDSTRISLDSKHGKGARLLLALKKLKYLFSFFLFYFLQFFFLASEEERGEGEGRKERRGGGETLLWSPQ